LLSILRPAHQHLAKYDLHYIIMRRDFLSRKSFQTRSFSATC
jgi:hypothetical protein